jgi:hypothetical protein
MMEATLAVCSPSSTPGEGHEKGGVEGEAGFFRRNHLVPVPAARDLDESNAILLAGCEAELERAHAILTGRQISCAAHLDLGVGNCLRSAWIRLQED